MELENTSSVSLIKGAVRDFKKLIKRENQRIAKEDYTDMPDSRYYDRGFVQGMISAKIFFERYYKRYFCSSNFSVVWGFYEPEKCVTSIYRRQNFRR